MKSGKESGKEAPEANEQFRMIFNKMPDAVIIIDSKGMLLEANEMTYKMSGYRKSELLGTNVITGLDILDNKTKALVIKKLMLPFSGGEILPFETEIHRKDRTTVPIEVNPQIIDYKGRKAELVSLRDITERRKAEEQVRKTSEEWERTFNSIVDFVYILDSDFRILSANRTFMEFLKMRKEEIIGRKCFELFHKTDRPVPGCPMVKTLKTKKQHTGEIHDQKSDLSFIVSTSPILNEKREIASVVHIAKDVTERKKEEERMEKLNKELISKVEELERFNKLAVGRELKMIELKKRIKMLESELAGRQVRA